MDKQDPMSRSPLMHSTFFSSLKQVEKRFKLEDPSSSHTQGCTMTDSLSSPICLLIPDHQTKQSTTLDNSEFPREFISVSHKFSTTQDDSVPQPQSPENQPDTLDEDEDDNDDIQLLMQLLRLSSFEEESTESDGENPCVDGEFYAKVVGMKGPKCQREVERLEGWIRHFKNNGGENTLEPLRLAHLLLAKAASVSSGHHNLDFPSTIQDFLMNDPPTPSS